MQGTAVDSFQTTWQVNVMAPALLTELLLPFMTPTAHIVNMSSELHRLVRRVSLNGPPTTSGTSTYDYAFSKACQVLHAHELTLRFQNDTHHGARRAMAVEPGLVQTNIARHASPFLQWIQYQVLGKLFLRTMDQGCATALYCLLSPNIAPNDYYFANCAPKAPTTCCASLKNVSAQQALFEKVWNTST